MSKFPLFVVLTLLFSVMLGAEEFALRQANDVRWVGLHVRTADNCEIVFWSDAIQGDMDIYAQKINPSGVTVWNEVLPIEVKPGDQEILDVVQTSDNNFIILWRDYSISGTIGVWVQKITSNGQRLWGEEGVQLFEEGQYIGNAFLVANNVGGSFVLCQYQLINTSLGIIKGQNLDALGNQLWQADGIQLVLGGYQLSLDQAVSDGSGGVIINYSKPNDTNINYLLRISDTGSVIGNNPLMPISAFPGSKYRIIPASFGQYILYDVSYVTNPFIRLTKIDNLGNLLLPQIVEYPLSTYDYIQDVALVSCSYGGLVVAWKSSTETSIMNLRIQRLSETFIPQWPQAGVLFGTCSQGVVSDISLSVDAIDNIWIAWDNGYAQVYKAQMVSVAGALAWAAEGLTLSEPEGYPLSEDKGNPLAIAYPDRAMFIWRPVLEGKSSVRRQVISSGGAFFLAENGEPMVQRIYGIATLGDVIAFNNNYLSIWSDGRGTGQVFYQLCNQNMEPPLLEENGRALNPPGYKSAMLVSALQVGENSVAVLYYVTNDASSSYSYFLQQIDSNGNTLYPEYGITLPTLWVEDDIAVSTFNGEIYVYWGVGSHIIGQRIVNGQMMWGDDGRIITQFTQSIYPSGLEAQGRYITWQTAEYNDQNHHHQTFALLVDENGDPAPGWEVSGLRIINDGNSNWESISNSGLMAGDLITFIYQYTYSHSPVLAQRITSTANRLWGESGVELVDWGHSNKMSAVYDDGITFLLGIYSGSNRSQIRIQKLSAEGELLWGESGSLVADSLLNCYDGQLGKFANGSYFCVYTVQVDGETQNRDVFVRYITPQGIPQGEAPSVFCNARYQQSDVQAAVLGNQALIAWNDNRTGIRIWGNDITGVWGNRVISDYVAADDPLDTPPALLSLAGNYPNPFNPSTTISFELGISGSTEVSIYNLKGQLVRTLLSSTDLLAGKHSLVWNGTDDNGKTVSSGIYLCRVSSAGSSATRKMVLAK